KSDRTSGTNGGKKEITEKAVTNDQTSEKVKFEIIQDDDISQWALVNYGGKYFSTQFSNEWEADKRIAQKGIDINYKKKELEIKREVTVAIIDTGIDLSQINDTNLWRNDDEIPDDNIDNDRNGYIDDYYGWNFCDNNSKITSEYLNDNIHGTHIAGILSAKNKKYKAILTDPKFNIMCIKALERAEGTGDVSNIIKAIKYAEESGAQICNLSLCVYVYSDELKKAMEESSMLFIVSAGNDSAEINKDTNIYPTSFRLNNVISVANLRFDGNLSKTSNYGEYVDIAAPGTDIISTISNNKFACMSGTSCATPYVTGLAAIIYGYTVEQLNSANIKQIICQNATCNKQLNGYISKGRMINFDKAICSIDSK
ncbi:MAG: S8 family serine peptidase, partial [Eubacterium sp.]